MGRQREQTLPELENNPEDYLPLTPAAFHILLSLSDGEKHGYAIMREVEDTTGGRMKMGPGTLYGAIKRLVKAGLIAESDERPDPALDDSRRRYYALTEFGRRVLAAEVQRLDDLVAVARQKELLPSPTRGRGAES
jgi:DNA-binding PadR family transcriptional regulator